MDVTNSFKECIKKLHSSNNAVTDILDFKSGNSKEVDKKDKSSQKLFSLMSSNIIKVNRKQQTEFSKKIKQLISAITQMKNFLVDNRKDYINIYSFLLSHASTMTDFERDQIDERVQEFMKNCNDTIKKLRMEALRQRSSQQLQEHQLNLLDLIESYLKVVCNIHSEQKAIKVRRAFERQRMARLASTIANKNTSENKAQTKNNFIENTFSKSANFLKFSAENVDGAQERLNVTKPGFSKRDLEENKENIKTQKKPQNSFIDDDKTENELSKEETQLLEQENEHLYHELNSMVDEVKQIEGKVVEIARLQEIFTDKVLQQEHDINRVGDAVVASTEDIRFGNDQLREAMRKKAGLRVWILFVIIILSFTLLFLDWYNP